MKDEDLLWRDLDTRVFAHTPVFDVMEKVSENATGVKGKYYVLAPRDWVVVLPKKGDAFVMVRQWRHGSACMTMEFPGGTIEPGEDPTLAAHREMTEEIAYRAGRMTKLGVVNPNPALFNNHFHIYLAEDLTPVGAQHLDADEFINILEKPVDEVLASFGTGEYIHAFMGTALGLYLREMMRRNKN